MKKEHSIQDKNSVLYRPKLRKQHIYENHKIKYYITYIWTTEDTFVPIRIKRLRGKKENKLKVSWYFKSILKFMSRSAQTSET